MFGLDRLNHLQRRVSQQLAQIQSDLDLLVLSNRLVSLISEIQEIRHHQKVC